MLLALKRDVGSGSQTIVNSSKELGRDMLNIELRNIFLSLPRNYEPIVTAILEAKDLAKLELEIHPIPHHAQNNQLY